MDVYQRRRLVALSALAARLRHPRAADSQLRRRRRGATPLTSAVAGTTGAGGATALSQEDFVEPGRRDLPRDEHRARRGRRLRPGSGRDRAVPRSLAGELAVSCRRCPAARRAATDKLDNFLAALQEQVAGLRRAQHWRVERGDDARRRRDRRDDRRGGRRRPSRPPKRFGFEVCGDTSEVGESAGGETATTDERRRRPTTDRPGRADHDDAGARRPTTTPVTPARPTPAAAPRPSAPPRRRRRRRRTRAPAASPL